MCRGQIKIVVWLVLSVRWDLCRERRSDKYFAKNVFIGDFENSGDEGLAARPINGFIRRSLSVVLYFGVWFCCLRTRINAYGCGDLSGICENFLN